MNVRVYQINPDRDKNRVMYERLDALARYQGSSKVDESLYDRVLRADVDCENLEQLYTMPTCSGTGALTRKCWMPLSTGT